jgi:hypothetical protein
MLIVNDYLVEQKIKTAVGLDEKKEDFLEKVEGKQEGAEGDSRERTFHSFRSREDVPKYLLQFDASGKEQQKVDKNNLAKYQGDSLEFLNQEKYVWDLVENKKMNIANTASLPSMTEIMYRKSLKQNTEKEKNIKDSIEMAYGVNLELDKSLAANTLYEQEIFGEHENEENVEHQESSEEASNSDSEKSQHGIHEKESSEPHS